MEALKKIRSEGIAAALAKAERYRFLNEPEEAESICRDVLAVEPSHQLAQRVLGLAITDQFNGSAHDRFGEAYALFQAFSDEYSRHYYTGIAFERRAKAQMRSGRPLSGVVTDFEQAMGHFEAAENVRPSQNDDAILRWNRCVRLLQTLPEAELRRAQETDEFEAFDASPQAPHKSRVASTRATGAK